MRCCYYLLLTVATQCDIASSKVSFTFVADLATCFAFKSYSLLIYDPHRRLPARQRIHIHVAVAGAADDDVAAGDVVSPCFGAALCRLSARHLDAIHVEQRLQQIDIKLDIYNVHYIIYTLYLPLPLSLPAAAAPPV